MSDLGLVDQLTLHDVDSMDGENIAQKYVIEKNFLHMIWEGSQVMAVSRRMHRYTRELRTRQGVRAIAVWAGELNSR